MAKTYQIRDIDKGYRKMMAEAAKRGSFVEVGVLGPKAMTAKGIPPPAQAKKPRRRMQTRGPKPQPTVADVAGWQEIGTATIPPRPFIGGWFDAFKEENRKFAKELALKRMEGKLTYERSLQLMGIRAKAGIQKFISDGINPPNAPSTIARKKSSKPLIDTGQLRSSIDFRIVSGGGIRK